MYSNGYVPPKPDPNRRRTSRAAYSNADASSVAGQGSAAYGMPSGYSAYSPQGRQSMGVPSVGQGGAWQQGQPTGQWPQAGGYPPPQGQNTGSWMQPPQEPQGYQGQGWQPSQEDDDGKPPRKGKGALVVFILVLVVVFGGIAGHYTIKDQENQQFVSAYDNLFCQGVYVDGIHLGGMTQQEGLQAVTQQAQQRNDAWSVRLTYNGQLVTEIKAEHLGMRVDVAETLNQAWRQGHEGDSETRRLAMLNLQVTPFQAYTALPGGDTSVIDTLLEDIRSKVYRAPQDAWIKQFNPEASDPFTFQEEVVGRSLDTEPIKQKLYQMVSTMESGEIAIEPQIYYPQVTVEQLKKLVTKRADVSTKISSTSTENRTNNIRRAFQLISGQIVQPGQTFSFNNVVGERETSNGFYEAIEYAYGEEVMGIGGGVCQASSTLYHAAVNAGLEIVKREQHSKPVNYCDMGLDATVLYTKNRKIDFTFKNNTDSPIYIVAAVQPESGRSKRLVARCAIYGKDLGNVSYKLEAVTMQELDPPEEPEYIKDKKAQYVTYTDQEKVVANAQKGYVVDSYRVTYVDGVETERFFLFTDKYDPKPKQIYVGVTKRK